MKLTQIDSLFLSDHSCLEQSDYCFFFGEYSAGQGYGFSEVNQLIFNFKKDVTRRSLPDWPHKLKAINQVADLFLNSNLNFDTNYTWVPIPPSKAEDDQGYDDRLWQVLEVLKSKKHNLDIRKIIKAKQTRPSAHLSAKRPSVNEHLSNWYVDISNTQPKPKGIIIFDDLLTTGASFKAAQALLISHFPNVPIVGIFIGRRVPYNPFVNSSLK